MTNIVYSDKPSTNMNLKTKGLINSTVTFRQCDTGLYHLL